MDDIYLPHGPHMTVIMAQARLWPLQDAKGRKGRQEGNGQSFNASTKSTTITLTLAIDIALRCNTDRKTAIDKREILRWLIAQRVYNEKGTVVHTVFTHLSKRDAGDGSLFTITGTRNHVNWNTHLRSWEPKSDKKYQIVRQGMAFTSRWTATPDASTTGKDTRKCWKVWNENYGLKQEWVGM